MEDRWRKSGAEDRVQMTKGRAQIAKKNTITKTVIGGEMEKVVRGQMAMAVNIWPKTRQRDGKNSWWKKYGKWNV